MDHFWLVFCAAESPRLGGTEDDETLKIIGRAPELSAMLPKGSHVSVVGTFDSLQEWPEVR